MCLNMSYEGNNGYAPECPPPVNNEPSSPSEQIQQPNYSYEYQAPYPQQQQQIDPNAAASSRTGYYPGYGVGECYDYDLQQQQHPPGDYAAAAAPSVYAGHHHYWTPEGEVVDEAG